MRLFSHSFVAIMIGFAATTAFAERAEDLFPPYPEWGVDLLQFKACTASGHVAEVQYKVSNFSATDLTLPDGNYTWASKEETAKAAYTVFSQNVPPLIATHTDQFIKEKGDDYMMHLAQMTVYIHAEKDGQEGHWPYPLDHANMLQTKMLLLRENKWTGFRTYYGSDATWVKVDENQTCDPAVSQ